MDPGADLLLGVMFPLCSKQRDAEDLQQRLGWKDKRMYTRKNTRFTLKD